jgi:hypothetical protein
VALARFWSIMLLTVRALFSVARGLPRRSYSRRHQLLRVVSYPDATIDDVLVFEPTTFIERLAALVPHPHKNLTVYAGVPNAKLRSQVVTYGVATDAAQTAVPTPAADGREEVSSCLPSRSASCQAARDARTAATLSAACWLTQLQRGHAS